jgi:hypothetical protein
VAERDDDAPLDELRVAWRTLAPSDPGERLDEPDPATRATLDWLRAAWQTTASDAPTAPPLRLPWRLRLTAARRRLLPLAPWLAAAGLLVALLREVTAPRAAPPPPSRGDLVVDASPDAAPVAAGPTIVHVPDPIAFPDVIPLTAVDAHRMEMRRGPVRLILVLPTAPPKTPESPHDAEPGSAKELR